ncbi:hypothetical protein Tco_0344560 [Tanacetum coccineum]
MMVKPTLVEYISVTQKNYLSNDNEERMVAKYFLEIQGTFLVKIRNNAFSGTIGENAVEHIEKFLKVVEPLKIRNISHDRFRLGIFPISLAGAIKGSLFDHETPLCKEFNEFIYHLKIDTDLFTLNIQGIKTYEDYEYELNNNMTCSLKEPWSDNRVQYKLCDHICEPFCFNNGKAKWPTCNSNNDVFYNDGEPPGMVRVGCMTYFQDHKWYNNLSDGVLKEEALMHKAIHEGSLGNATQGVRNFCSWLKGCFENFHKLDYELPFANTNLNATYNPHLDIRRVFDKNDGSKEHVDVHDKVDAIEKHEESGQKLNDDPAHGPPVCMVRSFAMTKYSFRPEEEYVAIKEHGHDDLARADVDACQAYQEIFRIMDDGWLVTRANE